MATVVHHCSISSSSLINAESNAALTETSKELSTPTVTIQTIEDSRAIDLIYAYWFGETIDTWSKTYRLRTKLWFRAQKKVDQEIKDKFEKYLIDAATANSSLRQRWQTTHRGKLALIILFDQFSRNIYRDTAKMFEVDSLALNLALEIIDDPTHVTAYSLAERIFVYYPLVHSENLIYTTRGAALLMELVVQVSQHDLRKQYLTSARSATTHQKMIELFGRFPQRNDLLRRQSTLEEEEYLKAARHGLVQSVQTIKRAISPSPAPDCTSHISCSKQSSYPLLKILVLHGFYQNANTLKYSAKKVFKELKDVATFYFANAPVPYNPTGKVKEQLLAVFDDENLPEINYQRHWWNASKDSKVYHHLNVSLYYIDQLFKSAGPFDGVLGFAEGAVLGSILSGLLPFGNISFNFVILISGFASEAEYYKGLMQPNSIRNVSSLHIYGIKDTLITNDQTLQLAAAFENPVVVSHPGGHFTPNSWPNASIRQFLLEQQKIISNRQETTISANIDQFQSRTTFEKKIEATILFHQRRTSTLPAIQRKRKKISVIPVGLSSPIDEQNIETIIANLDNYLFDDVMLLVWCERTTFHDREATNENDGSVTPPFFRHWIQLYLKKTDQVLLTHLSAIPKYGAWGDLNTIYICAGQMENAFSTKLTRLADLREACVKMVGDQLKSDHRVVLEQPDEYSDVEEEQIVMKSRNWISNCAKEAPRISNNYKKSTTVMAKEIAQYLQPLSTTTVYNEQQLSAWKGYAYQSYKYLISTICRILEKASPSFVDEQAKLRNRKDRGLGCTKEQREQLLTAVPSSHIIHPEPQPVVPCSLKELEPLLEHLSSNKPGPYDDKHPIVFPRGTIMSGGRLDLCKQVVGPQGVQPLLDAMKHSSVVTRLLLGNNIVGLPGAEAISQYIRLNADSNIDTWYLGCNKFDSECISLICDALAADTKVKALWLKRNPILAVGAVHIARMLTANTYLQTLDLLNTGLLDEGCEILFHAMKVNHSLKHLYIDANGLTVKSGRIIRLHFEQRHNHLETLHLSCNALGDTGTCEIAAGLKQDQHLKRLSLASNCVGPEGTRALVDALIGHTVLQQLNLGFMKSTNLLGHLNNVIGDDGAAEISRLIRLNHQIRSIDLTLNDISLRGLMQLRDALKENRTLTTLKGLQFGQVDNAIIKEEITTIIETNQIEWGKEVLCTDTDDTSLFTKSDYLKKGQQLDHEINFPEHIMEVVSHYRTE